MKLLPGSPCSTEIPARTTTSSTASKRRVFIAGHRVRPGGRSALTSPSFLPPSQQSAPDFAPASGAVRIARNRRMGRLHARARTSTVTSRTRARNASPSSGLENRQVSARIIFSGNSRSSSVSHRRNTSARARASGSRTS